MKLNIFTRRWGHTDSIEVEGTANGWRIKYRAFPHKWFYCDKRGSPKLFEVFDHESANYPKDLGGYMEWLWNQANANSMMTDAQVQGGLDLLSEWLQTVERSSPGGVFSNYK